MVQEAPTYDIVKPVRKVKPIDFLVFALYQNHLVAYKVETTTALQEFNLKMQLNSMHLKNFFPDQLTLHKRKGGRWQIASDLEKELARLIDEWIARHHYQGRLL